MDIIIERANKALCPICTKEIIEGYHEDFKLVEYKGQKILICKEHTYEQLEEIS